MGTGGKPKSHLTGGAWLLDSTPYPENLDHHFVVDPTKFDYYAMDCYRMLADDKMAETWPVRSSRPRFAMTPLMSVLRPGENPRRSP